MPAQRVSKSFKDLSLSFKFNPLSGELISLKNVNAIARAVRNIILTTPGEKGFAPEFGSHVGEILFDEACGLFVKSSVDDPKLSLVAILLNLAAKFLTLEDFLNYVVRVDYFLGISSMTILAGFYFGT